MAATTAGAIKAYLETLGLGVAVYRDRAPENTPLFTDAGAARPYVTVTEGISVVTDPAFNSFDDDQSHVIELAQVDVWQPWRYPEPAGGIAESYTLPDAVMAALDGSRLAEAPTHVAGMRLTGAVRLLEVDDNVVHHAFTVEIRRILTRA